MSVTKAEKTGTPKTARKSRVAELADALDSLISAFILALLYVTFVIRPFIIPTGSMADTLKGAHFRLRCPQCGFRYDYGFEPGKYQLPKDVIPWQPLQPSPSRCPNCGYYPPNDKTMLITKGDKILVLKSIYQFFEPRRWDVVVFRYPADPSVKYIKRLIGLPGETVEIIDGDIYINKQVVRKPPKVRNELWMPVYDNDYQPAQPREPAFNKHQWQQPFKNIADSNWQIDKDRPTIFHLNSDADKINRLAYNTSLGNDFRAAYAYDDVREYNYLPYCSDLMVRFYAQSPAAQGRIGISLSKYQTTYRASVDLAGRMVIAKVSQELETILSSKQIEPPAINKMVSVNFANVDHQLIFQFGKEKLTYDLGRGPEDMGQRMTGIEPHMEIFGSGKLTLSHIAVFRDIYYTSKLGNAPNTARAVEGSPLTLGADEFFMLGDNSPVSGDGRWWSEPGKGNHGRLYRQGIVPREYLVGKALFVFWPAGFRPFDKFPFAIIPDVGRMRFIYGGSARHQNDFTQNQNFKENEK